MKYSVKNSFDISFTHQLMATFTVGILVLTLGSTWMLTRISTHIVENRLVEEGYQLADSFAAQSTLALLYQSSDEAADSIASIMTFPDIVSASVLDSDLGVIASVGEKPQQLLGQLSLPEDVGLIYENKKIWEFLAPSYTGNSDDVNNPFSDSGEGGRELIGYVRLTMSKQILTSMQTRFLKYNLLVSFVFSIIVLALLFVITRRVTRPIKNLAQMMRRSKNGEKNHRATLGGAKDVVEMEMAFNSMMDVLDARELALSEARDQALKSAQMKGEFAANVSHELRTPMNGVIGMLELLSDVGLTEEQDEYVATARKSAQTLLTLIDDILDFSKNESGKVSLERTDFNLLVLLEDVVALLSPQARANNVDLAYLVEEGLSFDFVGDSDRIRQVLINLVGNAIKFTTDGDVGIMVSVVNSPSDMSADSEQLTLLFDVYDTGVGINEAAQEHIFETFLQEDGSTTRKYGGTGLGLAICRQLVDLLGGEISVESAVGCGSKFSFTIPLTKLDMGAGVVQAPQFAEGEYRVLVIDDSLLSCRLMAEIFAREGVECVVVSNASEGVRVYASEKENNRPFKFVFVDEQLKGENGRSVIKKLAFIDQNNNSHFILMSHLNQKHSQGGLMIAAAIHKPIQRSDVYSCINRIINPPLLMPIAPKAAPEQPSATAPRLSILVVEDNRTNQQVAVGMLERLGCHVDIAFNGVESLSLLESNTYDLVFMDCHMPEMDGYEATRRIRSLSADVSQLPIVAMTANAQQGDRNKCIAAGMNDYLAKPLTMSALKDALAKWLGEDSFARIQPETLPMLHEANSEIIERSYLADLYSSIGNVMYTMVQAYLEDLPIYLTSLEEAVAAKNTQSVMEIAHTVRGSSSSFGAIKLVDCCRRLEDLGRANQLDGMQSLLAEVQFESGQVLRVLSQEYQMLTEQSVKMLADKSPELLKQHILVVDDERSTRLAMVNILRNEGYFVEEACNGREAVLYCERTPPNLILMDAVMPELDGFSACSIIKNLPEGKDLPVLIITSLDDESSVSRAFSVGATDYISKPVNFAVLCGRIARLVQAYHTELYVKQLAYKDALTGLPNRTMFNEALVNLTRDSRRNNRKMALLFLDLDRFKLINDSLGHAAGDLLLKYFSERVQEVLRKGDMISRFGGDEFTILLDNVGSREDVLGVVSKIHEQLAKPFTFMSKEIHVQTSIGVAMFPDDSRDTGSLLKKADMAMYRAKDQGSACEFYEEHMKQNVNQRLDLENDLRGAIARGEFELHYQPQELLATGEVYGVEALVRWIHPLRGMLSPLEFIGLAEDTGQILALGDWVLNEACRQLKSWLDQGCKPLRMAVNISAKQLGHTGLVQSVAKVLEETGLAADYLELEITESNIMKHPKRVLKTLAELKTMGIKLSIDDFGTGYSSLSYLKRFPIDFIKIDRSFISDIAINKIDADIVKTIISLAHILGVKVIAEGVETEWQKNYLRMSPVI
ncbi:MAG: EAL domain-containing protein [Spongiibacteraceae bacterium]